jgi:dolichol kinase
MESYDILGVLIVYIYVAVLLIITEKLLKDSPELSRKILHIMVGNIAFLLPVFMTREIMAFVAAGPFIIFTFLMSPYTPIKKIKGRTSTAGHGMGLVYYAITWTILAYFFFDHMVVIAIGILAMSYGDGFASIIGRRYGKQTYNITGDIKSFVGTAAMFFFTFVTIIIGVLYYQYINSAVPVMTLGTIIIFLMLAAIAAIIEGFTPKGLDNLTVPLAIAFLYWFSFIR